MINNLLFDYNESSQIDNILSSGIHYYNAMSCKINFYNPLVSTPMQKFWYHIPNAKIIRKDHKLIYIALPTNSNKLFDSIKNLDCKTQQFYEDDDRFKSIAPSIIYDDNLPPCMQIYITPQSRCFSHENKIINHVNLQNENIKLYIEFDSIISTHSGCKRIWNLLQLKEHVPIDLNVSFFDILINNSSNHTRYPSDAKNQSNDQVIEQIKNQSPEQSISQSIGIPKCPVNVQPNKIIPGFLDEVLSGRSKLRNRLHVPKPINNPIAIMEVKLETTKIGLKKIGSVYGIDNKNKYPETDCHSTIVDNTLIKNYQTISDFLKTQLKNKKEQDERIKKENHILSLLL